MVWRKKSVSSVLGLTARRVGKTSRSLPNRKGWVGCRRVIYLLRVSCDWPWRLATEEVSWTPDTSVLKTTIPLRHAYSVASISSCLNFTIISSSTLSSLEIAANFCAGVFSGCHLFSYGWVPWASLVLDSIFVHVHLDAFLKPTRPTLVPMCLVDGTRSTTSVLTRIGAVPPYASLEEPTAAVARVDTICFEWRLGFMFCVYFWFNDLILLVKSCRWASGPKSLCARLHF